MSKVNKITPEYFADTKRILRWNTNRRTARKTGLSLKTVLQIRGSKTYLEYVEQKRAQHPEVKYSLADDVLALHKTVFDKGGEYHTPKTAQTAITQLNYELAKK